MPGNVGTSRTKFEEKDLAGKFPVAPVSVVQIYGEPHKDVDVDIRAKKSGLLAHWPPSKEHTGRLQWFGSNLVATPPADIPQLYLPEAHWFQKLRQVKSALYLEYESRAERFVAYDPEPALATPVKIRGGPDEYTLQNLSNRRLLDVAVIAPTDDGGFRVGWLDALPAAEVEKKDEEPKPKKAATEKEKAADQKKQAEELFGDADAKTKKDKAKEAEVTPLPAEGDANVRARVDQVLNRTVNVTVDQAPRRGVLDMIANQARFRYEVDDVTLANEQIDLSQPMSMTANNLAARDALAEVLGSPGLSYRVTEEGKLYITTAARLAEEASKKGGVVEGPPVKLVMPPARKPSEAGYREITRDTLARRLAGQGLKAESVQVLLDQYAPVLFQPGELIVLAHLSREAIDDTVLLDVFPPPKKFVRTALVVIHGVDPRLQDRARILVKQLGDSSYKSREAAETRLFEMGPVAVPALEDALTNKDLEVAFRAERLLLKLNRAVP
jgi:hypothetical protein